VTEERFLFENMVHLGAVLYLICFLFRNQVALRSFAIAGDFAYTAFYFGATAQPLWQAMFWSSLNIVINIAMLTLMWRENRVRSLSSRDRDLFDKFHLLAPKYFRRFIALATWHTAAERVTLVEAGIPPDYLFFVVSGRILARIAGEEYTQDTSIFTGELAYLTGNKPMGTTLVEAGSVYITWPVRELKVLLSKDEDLRNAVHNLLAAEIMEKFAGSIPAKHLLEGNTLHHLFDHRLTQTD
jgi:hypothetical protein